MKQNKILISFTCYLSLVACHCLWAAVSDSITYYVTVSSYPTITNNQPGDDTVRAAAGTAYNVDFFDDGSGLDTLQYKVSSAPAQTGTIIKDWTDIATLSGTTYYQTDWQVDFGALQNLPTTNYVSVRCWDVSGNTTTVNDVFYVMKDTVPPTSAVTSPGNETNIQTLTTISGTANDNYGLNVVKLQIKRLSDGWYWDGVDKTWSGTWNEISLTNPTLWTYTGLTDAYLTPGTSYQVTCKAVDAVSNEETPGAGSTFYYRYKRTIASGNWTDTAVWFNGQQPLDGDAVEIKTGHTVTLNAGTSNLYSLTIEGGGILDSPIPNVINITSMSGSGFYNYGTLANINGTCYFSEQKVIKSTDTTQQICGSIFFNSGSTVTLQSDVTFGYVGISAGGKLDAGSQQIKVNGNWQQDGTFSAGTSTVTFTSSNNQNINGTAPIVFNNFAVNSSSTVSPAQPLDITGNFTIQTGTFVAGNYEHTVAGDFKQSGGGFEAQSSTITFDGSSAQTVSVLAGTSFYCLQYTGTGSLTTNSNLDINGNFTKINNGTLNNGTYTYNLAGNVSLTPTVTGNNTVWIFDGTSLQTFSAGAYDKVVIDNSAGVTFSGAVVPNITNLDIKTNAKFDITDRELQVSGNFTSSGTFVNSGSTVTFSSAVNGTIWTVATSTFNNVEIHKSVIGDVVSALTSLNIGGWLKISTGTLNLGSTIHTVSGTTTIDGANAKLDIGSSTTTLVGQVDVLNGGTLLLPTATPAPVLKLGYNYLSVDTGGFFVSKSSNNSITSTNPGSSYYTFQCQNSTVDVTGVTLESAGYDGNGLYISANAKIGALDKVVYKTLKANNKALSLGYSTIPGTYTFTGHDFDASVSTNVAATSLTSGIVVMQDATGSRAGALYENDPNDRIFWQPGDSLTLVEPNGGETFVIGTSTTISWNTAGSIKNVKLEYSKDNFTNINFIADVSTGPTFGSYDWTIPNDSSPTVKVRVSALNYPTINTVSNAFAIQPPVAAPTNLNPTLVGSTSIQWQFTDNASDETGLYISSGTNVSMRLSENLGPLTGTGGTTSWWETGLSINTQYTRYAEAVNAVSSSWSTAISSYTAANPPTGSVIVERSSFSVQIQWSANSNPNYTRWGIVRSTESGFTSATTLKAFADNYVTTDYTDTGLNPNTNYWYKVNAYNEDGLATGYDTAVSTKTLPAPAVKLVVVVPGETYTDGVGKSGSSTTQTAGSSFVITVNAVDSSWEIDPTATQNVTVATTDSYDTEPSAANLVSGTKTFDIKLVTAQVSTITASATGLTDGASYLTVVAGLPSKLQVLVPGETAAAGSAAGKSGTPTNQVSGTGFVITVNAVDSYWNLVTSTEPTAKVTTSDPADTEPANKVLTNGTTVFTVTLITLGNTTITAEDVSATLTSDTSPNITVVAENTPPTVEVTYPTNNLTTNNLTTISGTAQDNVSVSSVTISIQRLSDNNYWDGANFASVTQLWRNCTVYPSSWTYPAGSDVIPSWVTGSSYTIVGKAMDTSNNWSTAYSTNTFTYDITAPTSAVVNPADGSTISTLGTISGTAQDNVTLAGVELRITQMSNSQYWNGSSWQASEIWLLASGLSTWQYTGIADSNLTDNTSYWIVSRASDTASNIETPGAGIKFTYLQPPTAPSNFYATSVAVSSIQWQFTDNASNETGLYVSSGTNTSMRLSGNLGPSAGVSGTVNWWETGLSLNTQYTRYAEAVNASGSSWSTAISSYTAASVPSGTTIISRSSYSVELDWSPNGNPEPGTSYAVVYSSFSNFTLYYTADPLSTSTHIATSYISPSTTYYFKVRAKNGDGIYTDYDTTVSTKTLPAPATKLVVVVPGETYTDGVGKSGSSTTQTAGSSFVITVNAVDSSWEID
ncbi:MAG: fibronectin type III domain-containing protein, partial [Candidatus Auribacterota bacterium]